MGSTVRDWLRRSEARLAPLIGSEEARRDARLLLSAATGMNATRLVVEAGSPIAPEALLRAEAYLDRRAAREPTAQILGNWPFFGRDFAVSRDVLTPRRETETLVDIALAEPFGTILDLGTGSGILAVTLLAERAETRGRATDLSGAALAVARGNAEAQGVAERLRFSEGDWWAVVPEGERYDLVVSNPPYVSARAYDRLEPEVTEFEPRSALTPGGDGLSAYRSILEGAPLHIVPGGRLVVEIGADQGDAVQALFWAAGLEEVQLEADLSGRDRVVKGRIVADH